MSRLQPAARTLALLSLVTLLGACAQSTRPARTENGVVEAPYAASYQLRSSGTSTPLISRDLKAGDRVGFEHPAGGSTVAILGRTRHLVTGPPEQYSITAATAGERAFKVVP